LFSSARKPKSTNHPRAIISPHAGYVFSGQVAASAFNQIPENTKYEKIFVLASSHQVHFKGASVYTAGNYKTPLGTIKVDLKLTKKLIKSNQIFSENIDAHSFEHSLEVQLPFLQYKLGKEFQLIPIILGTDSPEECEEIAHGLKPYFNSKNLFVISTDFSHYPNYEDAVDVDTVSANAVISNNTQTLLNALESNRKLNIPNLSTSMCGWTSVLTLMYLTNNNSFEYKKIQYMNSGDNHLYGGKYRVVGYHAIAVFNTDDDVFTISEEEKETLLEIAHRSLNDSYGLKKYNVDDLDTGGILQAKLGAFVSLYNGDELKGCIGQFKSDKPLMQVIKSVVISASNDRRFEKPDKKMLENIIVEISVLSPLKKIKSIEEIELGKHGIYIKKEIVSGTFLPQVAIKTGWNLEEFLGHCSRDKAGLGWYGWKDAEIFIYEAEIFKSNPINY
ncbi:MAG: AmmeMemoRadiSam system protein B, partial [Mariniphaga sp.]|nr:AmmeMemoRadiSam system protein B [Mariniphaga sp.]